MRFSTTFFAKTLYLRQLQYKHVKTVREIIRFRKDLQAQNSNFAFSRAQMELFDPKSIYSDTIPLKIIFGSVAGPMFTLETLENQHSFLCMFAFAEGVACFPAVLILNKGVHTVGTVLYVCNQN